MKLPRSIACLLAGLAVSCVNQSGDPSRPAATHQTFSQRLNESNGYAQDADGNWVPKIDKRSSFDQQGESAYFQGEYDRKSYQTTAYKKTSWWGNKDYQPKQYDGNTDGSRFQTTSRLDGIGARESGRSAGLQNPYKTGTYATGAAREAGLTGIAKPSDAETDRRRKVYKAPDIIDYEQQRALSLEQSKGFLGR